MKLPSLDRLMRCVTAVTLSFMLAVGPAWPQAALLPNAKQTFVDQNGNPLTGGKVYFYVPNTTNKKTTWSDAGETIPNTNPVTLDSAGRAIIFGQGSYQQQVTDSVGNQQWNALTTAYNSSAPSGATGTDTAPVGAVMQWSGFTLPVNWVYANGQALSRASYPDLLSAITISNTTVSCTASSATLGGWSDTSQMRVGAPVEASCIPTGSVITAITSSSTITINNNATSTATVTATVFPWGDGDGTLTFNVPDLRGRAPIGADTMQATPAGRLTVSTTISTTSSSSTATVGSATGLYPGMSVTSANVPYNATISTISGTTITLSANATATASGTAVTFGAAAGVNTAGVGFGSQSHTLSIAEMPSHDHGGATGSTAPAIKGNAQTSSLNDGGRNVGMLDAFAFGSGSSGVALGNVEAHTHTISAQGGGNPHSIEGPGITVNYIIKVKSNTTGAGGVVSIGGLFGDIALDSSMQAYTSGSPSVNYIGIATALTGAVLANVSGATAEPTPTSFTSWIDYVCGNSQGDIIYRGASAWSCLAPGTNGYVLATQGAGANPVWTPAPTVFPQSANTVYAGPTSGGASNPTFRALVGADLPNPQPTVLGGVRSLTATTHQFINQISLAGQPSSVQPACTDLSDSGTACQVSTGTSGATVPLLNGNNTFSGSMTNTGAVRAAGVITPTALTGTVNDYNPTGLSTANVIRQDGGAGDRTVTGLVAQPDGTIIDFINIGTTNNITLANQNAGSSAANRFLLPADTVLLPNTALSLRYDATTAAWRPYSRPLSNTGVTAGAYTLTALTVTTDGRISAASSASTTGTGSVVLQNAPSLLTPTLGVATATSINKVAFTTPATGSTLTIADGKTATFNNSIGISGTDGKTLTVSNSVALTGTDGSSIAFGTGGTVTYTIASGSSAMGTSAISSGTCATTVTATATGTATTDVVTASFNADPTSTTGYIPSTSGMLTIIAWPTANNVNFKVCNNTAGSITPGAVTINWRVTR